MFIKYRSTGICLPKIWVNVNYPSWQDRNNICVTNGRERKKSAHYSFMHCMHYYFDQYAEILFESHAKMISKREKKKRMSNSFVALFSLDYILEFYRMKTIQKCMLHICQ